MSINCAWLLITYYRGEMQYFISSLRDFCPYPPEVLIKPMRLSEGRNSERMDHTFFKGVVEAPLLYTDHLCFGVYLTLVTL